MNPQVIKELLEACKRLGAKRIVIDENGRVEVEWVPPPEPFPPGVVVYMAPDPNMRPFTTTTGDTITYTSDSCEKEKKNKE